MAAGDAVLAGPRRPLWGCSKCGEGGNWASRVRCRGCNAWASQAHQDRARAAARKAARGQQGGGAGTTKELARLQRELADAKKEVARLGAPGADASASASGASAGAPDVDVLASAHAANEKAYGKEHAITAASFQELQRARAKRDEAKTPAQRQQTLSARIKQHEADLAKIARQNREDEASITELRANIERRAAKAADLRGRRDADQAALADLAREGAPEPAAPPQLEALFPHLRGRASPEDAPKLEELARMLKHLHELDAAAALAASSAGASTTPPTTAAAAAGARPSAVVPAAAGPEAVPPAALPGRPSEEPMDLDEDEAAELAREVLGSRAEDETEEHYAARVVRARQSMGRRLKGRVIKLNGK